MRILVFTTDVPPVPGVPSSGTALRSYGFARGFESHGCEVLLSVPRGAILAQLERKDLLPQARSLLQSYLPLSFDHRNSDALCEQLQPDSIYCGHWPAMTFGSLPKAPVIVDLAGPHLLERHFQREPDQGAALRGKLINLASADLFVVSGRKQLEYFSAFMDRAGVMDAESRTFFVPMALDPNLPVRSRPEQGNSPRFLFAGIFLPWQDPSKALRTTVEALDRRKSGELRLIGGLHPTYSVGSGVYEELFNEIEKSPRVSRSNLVPLEELNREMLSADVALDLMKWNLERELAVTIRTTTYLWSGLPVIYNNFADLSQLIERYGAGWTLDPEDADGLRGVIDEIFANPEAVSLRSGAAQKLARAEFSWTTVTEPIVKRLTGCNTFLRTSTDFAVDQPEDSGFVIEGERTAAQEFVCRRPGLSSVGAKFHLGAGSGSATLVLTRIAHGSEQLVSERRIDLNGASQHQWHAVEVAPAADSAGAHYRLTVRSETKAVSPWVAKTQHYPLLGFEYSGRKTAGHAMNIRVQCTGPITGSFR